MSAFNLSHRYWQAATSWSWPQLPKCHHNALWYIHRSGSTAAAILAEQSNDSRHSCTLFYGYCEHYVTLPTNLGDALLKILTDKFALTIFRAHAHSCDNDWIYLLFHLTWYHIISLCIFPFMIVTLRDSLCNAVVVTGPGTVRVVCF